MLTTVTLCPKKSKNSNLKSLSSKLITSKIHLQRFLHKTLLELKTHLQRFLLTTLLELFRFRNLRTKISCKLTTIQINQENTLRWINLRSYST